MRRGTLGRRAALWGPYVAVVLARVLIAANGYYPVVQPDEVIYREASRWFAGVGPVPNLADGYFFPLGYPLLVAPLWWLFDSLAGLGGGLLVLNALVGGAVYFPLRYLLIRLSGASEAVCTVAAAVTGLYPAYLGIAGMWATDNAFVPLFVLLMATAWWFFEAPSGRRAVAYGALAAALYCVHERALLILAVVAAQLVWMGLRGHLRRWHAGLALGALVAGFGAVRWLMTHAAEVLYRGEPVERPLLVVLGKLLRVDGWIDVLLQASGQGWYLLVATYGLGAMGLTVVVAHLRRQRAALWTPGEGSVAGHVALLLLLATGVVFATTSVYFPENPITSIKPEFMFFGRICEGSIPVLLGLGLAWPAERRRFGMEFSQHVLVWMAAAVMLGFVMVAGRGMEALSDAPGTYGVFGVRWFLRDGRWLLEPVAGTVAVGAVACGAAWVLRRRRIAFVAVVGLSFLWLSADISVHYMGRRLQRIYGQAIVPLLERAGGVERIASDTRAFRVGRFPELIRRVEVEHFSSRDDARPPADVVVTRREWEGAEDWGARFLVGERDRNYGVWALPGPEAERLYHPPDPRQVVYGAQAIWSVWEEGFEEQELWRGPVPARWTDGKARLSIPLGTSSPAYLRLDVAESGPKSTSLRVRVNGRRRMTVQIGREGWSGDVSLAGVPLGDELRVELASKYEREPRRMMGWARRLRRGVLVRGISLLEFEEAAVVGESFLETRGAPPAGELRILDDPTLRWASDDAPLVLTVEVTNTGTEPWPGRTGPDAPGAPRVVAAWRGATAAEAVEVPLPRPVLPGRSLYFPLALEPRRADGSVLPPGEHVVDLDLAWAGAADGGARASVAVRVLRQRPDHPFAPLDRFARFGFVPPPPFVLMPPEGP